MPSVQVVEVDAAEAEAELAADALWQAGATAVSEEPLPGGRVRLRADVGAADGIDRRWRAVVVEPDTAAHLDAWRAHARPQRVGAIVLHPAWLPPEPVRPGDLLVRLDPGRAFGSGSHPSTRAVLDVLPDLLPVGGSVLDVGCGSGVLAIAAARLGAGSVVAVDVDPEAVRATQANAVANGVRVEVSTSPVERVRGSFDVVLANIGAGVLVELAAPLVQRTTVGGHLVLAGLLADRAAEVVGACAGTTVVERSEEDGWASLVLRR